MTSESERLASWVGQNETMREALRKRIVAVCDAKIGQKGPGVGLSFYAFFANSNDDPQLLMEAATWWILEQRLDHFEKATKVKSLVESLRPLPSDT